jgi:SAM-dependent methyltransferase
MKLFDDTLATMELRLAWEQDGIGHLDCQHAQRVNFWRDILPPQLVEAIRRQPGVDTFELDLEPGAALPRRSESGIVHVRPEAVERRKVDGLEIVPRLGRFYPRGILSGVPGIFRGNAQPFRCIGLTEDSLTADLNHPLAGKHLRVEVKVHALRPKFDERGGTAIDWLELASTGPGIQARADATPTDFFADDPFTRLDAEADGIFYERPRLVQHLDAAAIGVVSRLYGKLIRPGADVLDLLGSWSSHLPEPLPLNSLTVLGMNGEELAANPRATERVVHDLNRDPRLPFGEGRFDAVVCTVSVEYLTRPFDVFAEVARVLKPGGVFAATFSNRWFPPKVIRVWPVLHEFERMGLVLEYFLHSGKYTWLRTYSLRGLPRPANDRHAALLPYSDPVYAVWGQKG